MDEPRAARPTLKFIDEYCAHYRNLFSDVRSFEAFKHLHVGMISSTKRKTLPAIAELVGLPNEQSLHHFLTQSPWQAQQLRNQRLSLTLQGLKGRKIFVIIDETRDKKKGRSTDYVSRQYLGCLEKLKLNFIVAIRSNHGVWLPKGQRVRQNQWRKFTRTFSDETKETRFVREIIFGKKGDRRYWEVTTDPETMPANSTSYVMTEIPHLSYKDVGNLYGCRNWVEYALNMSKNELGWADFRLTHYEGIEKWWELVSSAYLLVSLFTIPWKDSNKLQIAPQSQLVKNFLSQHPDWDLGEGWKNLLKNLRLISQPFIGFNLIQGWLKVFPIPQLSLGFPKLISLMNLFPCPFDPTTFEPDYLFSSA